ncbi:MAG: hypothetical protein CMK06_14110 [Ponticaulis sp.]|nr:hypothetical protein [Ponticaulis sp.]
MSGIIAKSIGFAGLSVLANCTSVPPEPPVLDMGHGDIDYVMIHSDLPLFSSGDEGMWPRPFADDDSFGCVSSVSSGDWRLDFAGGEESEWIRLENYGAFHCWMNSWSADQRDELGRADALPTFFIHAADAKIDGKAIALWAVQIGALPGSEYMLLSRSRGSDPEKFTVLQKACPEDAIRNGEILSILRTEYCAINSKQDLIELMKEMAAQSPAGQLIYVGDYKD